VITDTDYFNRLAFDAPLDVKFRSDALGKTVLFIGYRMNDMNIWLLLHNLWRTWKASGYERIGPSPFMPCGNPIQQAILHEWGVQVLGAQTGDPAETLTNFLDELGKRVST